MAFVMRCAVARCGPVGGGGGGFGGQERHVVGGSATNDAISNPWDNDKIDMHKIIDRYDPKTGRFRDETDNEND